MARFGDDKLYTGSTIFSKKDNWFYNSNHENRTKFNQTIHQMIKENQGLYSFRPKSLANLNGDAFVFGSEPIFSHYYPIRKIPGYI